MVGKEPLFVFCRLTAQFTGQIENVSDQFGDLRRFEHRSVVRKRDDTAIKKRVNVRGKERGHWQD